jgi:hypothetical protein
MPVLSPASHVDCTSADKRAGKCKPANFFKVRLEMPFLVDLHHCTPIGILIVFFSSTPTHI